MRMSLDGYANWMLKVAGTSPGDGITTSDRCLGLHFEESQASVIALVQTKSRELRRLESLGDFYDVFLVFVGETGTVQKSVALSLAGVGHDLFLNSMSLLMTDQYLYMGAMSSGFNTNMH